MLSSCGGSGQISVSLTGPSTAKAGDTVTFVAAVVNNGPGDAPGVNVVVAMPNGLHYKSTSQISDDGSARTQPLDARVGTSEPQWGFWDIAGPSVQAGSSGKYEVDITFTVDVEANPDTYNLVARAQGDNTSGAVLGKSLSLAVKPSPHLGASARVDTTMLNPSATTTYRVTITNTGSDTASDVGLLVTLPPVLVFQASAPFSGNASRNNPVDPIKGTVEVFYGGFVLPAASTAGPGYVTVAFTAQVVPRPVNGSYPISVQVTDSLGDVVSLTNVAPITVQGAPSPTPTVSGGDGTGATPSPTSSD
ncbi:MAG: DUF11 domain-containing protein [Candidatus Dormibacteraeota bacterium]|nr:DUF11 domain-containing protein [Candidatus Dormibacteraeota bacterium]MBV9524917.1 DUF11 domain-containing protein [Candidatus Dormibacteraeota bacterium]